MSSSRKCSDQETYLIEDFDSEEQYSQPSLYPKANAKNPAKKESPHQFRYEEYFSNPVEVEASEISTHLTNKPPRKKPSLSINTLTYNAYNSSRKRVSASLGGELYFKTSASSTEGYKVTSHSNHYDSHGSAKSVTFPSDLQFSEPNQDYKEEHEEHEEKAEKAATPIEQDRLISNGENVSLANNAKLVFDQNTDRSRKRVQQMKKIRNSRGQSLCSQDDFLNLQSKNVEQSGHSTTLGKNFAEDQQSARSNFSQENENSIINNPSVKEEPSEKAELIVSDLDCSYEEKEIKITHKRQKSFVPITNNLTVKNSVKEDSATPSYLMALYNCMGVPVEDSPEKNANNNLCVNSPNNNYDSLEKENLQEKIKENFSINKNDVVDEEMKILKHKRWQSGKYLHIVNSIIEEEISETFTDSEISNKKKSFLFSKSKYESSDKKATLRSSRDFQIEKNLESAYFNKIKNMETDFSDLSNIADKCQKSPMPKRNRKIAKSEVFNIQIDLKKTFEDISKKIYAKDEQSKSKVESKKKELLDKFFNKSSEQFNTVNMLQSKIKNISIDEIKNMSESSNSLFIKKQILEDNFTTKISREQTESIILAKIEEGEENSREDFDMKLQSPIKETKTIKQTSLLNNKNATSNSNSNSNQIIINNNFPSNNLMSNEDSSNIISNLQKTMKEKYKKQRKNSSIFKSEDLRISRADNNNLFISPKISTNMSKCLSNLVKENPTAMSINTANENCSYININNNINIYSPVSVNSIKNEMVESNIGSNLNEKINWDKTMTMIGNPFDSVKINSEFDEDFSYNKVNRRLFDCLDCEVTPRNNLFDQEVEIKKLTNNMVITSEIHLAILPVQPIQPISLPTNEKGINDKQSFKESIGLPNEATNTSLKMKHYKTTSLINKHYTNNSNYPSVNLQAYLNTLLRDKIFDKKKIVDSKSNASKNTRSYSGSAKAEKIKEGKPNFSKEKNKYLKENANMKSNPSVSSVSYNQPNASNISSVTNVSNLSNVCPLPQMKRLNTPNYLKSKNSSICTSDFKNILSHCNNNQNVLKKNSSVERIDKIEKIDKKLTSENFNKINSSHRKSEIGLWGGISTLGSKLTLRNYENVENKFTNPIPNKNTMNAENKINVPEKILKRKPHSYRTISEIPIQTANVSNKVKIIEGMKILNFQKGSNLDHFKTSLEKLSRSKSLHFLLLVENNKKGIEFRGVYEVIQEKQILIRLYSVSTAPNIINFSEIVKQYSIKQNTFKEALVSINKQTNIFTLTHECVAITIQTKK